jgi:hypothetical protein
MRAELILAQREGKLTSHQNKYFPVELGQIVALHKL